MDDHNNNSTPEGSESWPRVTEILKACGLVNYDGIPERLRIPALDRGRDVHMVCESIDRDEPDYWTGTAMEGYAEAYLRLKEETGFTPTMIERQVFNPQRQYKGRLDRAGVIATGDRVLWDLKSGIVAKWTALQTAAYSACLPEPYKRRRFGVQLRPDGRFTMTEFPDFRQDANYFFCCVSVVHGRYQFAKATLEEGAYVHD